MTRNRSWDNARKHILVSKETHKQLASMGSKLETFEDIIIRLINVYNKEKGETYGKQTSP